MLIPGRLSRVWASLSLLSRIAVVQSVVLFGAAFAVTGLLMAQYRGEAIQEQQAKARVLVLVAMPVVAEQAVIGDYATLNQVLERQASVYPDTASLVWRRDGRAQVEVDANPPVSRAPTWFKLWMNVPAARFAAPVALGGVAYGELEAIIAPSLALKELWGTFLRYALATFFAACLVMFSLLIVLRANTRVLHRLVEAADRFGQGFTDVRIAPAGAREVRMAAVAFNAMAARMGQMLSDLTESRERLHEQLRFEQALIETMPMPVFYKDERGIYLNVNKAWENFFSIPREQVIGQTVDALYAHAPEIAAFHSRKDDELARGYGSQSYEISARTRGGREYHALYTKALLTDASGRTTGLVGTITDVTELKSAEQRARQALVEKSAAEHASEAKSLFLANMSHEIRTPLNGVLGLAQIGLRESRGRRSAQTFERILASGRHLHGVINAILDFSKIESGKLFLEQVQFAVGDVIDQAVALIAPQAEEKNLEFRVTEAPDLPERMEGDPTRITQVLLNLLGNAIKFTPHGRVELDVRCSEKLLIFRITDSGIGMNDAQMQRIFKPFEQADGSTTRRFGGTGLGLAISRSLAQMMGGDIAVTSRPGEGSTFEMRTPITGERSAPRTLPEMIILAGLPERDATKLAEAMQERGQASCVIADVLTALTQTGLLVISREAFHRDGMQEGIQAVLAKGGKVLVAVEPGRADEVTELPGPAVGVVEYPLRARQVIAAAIRLDGEARGDLSAGARLSGIRVLAAEDTEVNRLVLEDLLTNEGATVTFAMNGQEALDRLAVQGAEAFDVVLMDVQMPVMDGYEATQYLRERAPQLPVIGLTAHAFAEEKAHCLEVGMVEHLSKPVDLEALVEAVRRHVRGADAAAGVVSPLEETPAVASVAGGIATSPMSVADNKVIDWPALFAEFGGRREFITKLVSAVLRSHGDSPAKLRQAAAADDLKSLAFLAHALKGVGGNVKAVRVHEVALRADASARTCAEPAEARALAGELAEAVEDMLAAFTEFLEPEAAGAG